MIRAALIATRRSAEAFVAPTSAIATQSASRVVEPVMAAKKVVRKAPPKKAAPAKKGYTGMLSKAKGSDSYLNRIYGTTSKSLYP